MNLIGSTDTFLFDRFRFDRRGGGLFRLDDGVRVPLGSRALDVLSVLIEHAGELVSKDEIMEAVWPGIAVEDANLTVQVSALRRVLDDGLSEAGSIQTIPGRGYRFIGRVRHHEAAVPSGPSGITQRAAQRLSIVVLPFKNLSDDGDQQYFAEGITEDLTTDLSRIAEMVVISCNTAFTYKGRPVSARQVGRELAVRYVLEGSVQRSGYRVRINAQLIDAETDAHLWAERFERDIGNLFALQNEITGCIAVALNFAMIEAEAKRPTAKPDALDYFFQGRALASRPPTPDRNGEVIRLLERALALDSGAAEVQARLAFAFAGRVLLGFSNTRIDDITRAESLLGKALALSPHSPRAHWAKGQVLRAQHRYAEAISEYETAIALDRNLPGAYANLGQSKLLTGSLEDVIPLMERAIRLSPRDPDLGYWYDMIGLTHLLQSRVDEAIGWFEKACSASPARPIPRASLAAAYGLKGESERAATELAKARELSGAPDAFFSITRMRTARDFMAPKVRALYEATYDVGLRKAGMPED